MYDGSINPREIGDKVIINPDNNVAIFVQVFKKNPQVSFKAAVEDTILKGYSSADCYFRSGSPYDHFKSGYHGSLKTGIIDFPFSNEYGSGGTQRSFAAYDKCPKDYVQTDIEVKRYFGYDPKHPNKYAFIRIDGSYPGSGNYFAPGYMMSWDETLQFIN